MKYLEPFYRKSSERLEDDGMYIASANRKLLHCTSDAAVCYFKLASLYIGFKNTVHGQLGGNGMMNRNQSVRDSMRQNIRKLRKNAHISQEQMANLIGISRRTYAAYECGDRTMPVDALVCIADFFDVSLDELVGRSGTPESDL